MLKKLICFLWGHKFTEKAATGQSIKSTNLLTGALDTNLLFYWSQLQFCPRCGTLNPNYDSWRKMRETWDKIQSKPYKE